MRQPVKTRFKLKEEGPGDLYELAKILGHSNIKMTERYAKLARQHYRQNQQHEAGNVEVIERAAPKVKVGKRMFAYCSHEKFLHAL